MIELPDIPPGTYHLFSHVEGGEVPLGKLWLWPLAESGTGRRQWLVELDPALAGDNGLPAHSWALVMARLGMHPVRFESRFYKALRSPEPIAILADTSALYSGAAFQVCHLRRARPTLFAVPDQAYMEAHAQRELETLGDKCPKHVRTLLSKFLALRVLRRLRASGQIISFSRPPDAMVRYLGSELGAPSAEESASPSTSQAKAPNFVRDRLILEAARTLVRENAGTDVYVLTNDEKLSLQSALEGFHPALCSVPRLPTPARYTSPWVSPHTLKTNFLPPEELLAELLWTLGSISARSEATGASYGWSLPGGLESTRLLLEEARVQFHTKTSTHHAVAPAANAGVVPQKAPPPQSLVNALLKLADGGQHPVEDVEDCAPFLSAAGWATREAEVISATAEGLRLAERWRSLSSNDGIEWCAWIEQAGLGVQRVQHIRQLLHVLRKRSGASTTDQLRSKLPVGERDLSSQLVLAAAFGVIIRLSGKVWAPAEDAVAVDEAIMAAVKRVAGRSRSSAAAAERVFTDLLRNTPLPLHVFRRGVLDLVRSGRLRPGGTMEKAAGDPVRMRTIVPDGAGGAKAAEVNLATGDFLVPGASSQDLILATEAE